MHIIYDKITKFIYHKNTSYTYTFWSLEAESLNLALHLAVCP